MAICKIVGSMGCQAPAGWRTGLGIALNGRGPRLPHCSICGESVCKSRGCSLHVGDKYVCAECVRDAAKGF
jgi:hypothetical protein